MADQNETLRKGRTRSIWGIALVSAVAFGGYLVWSGKILGGKPLCDICKRELHKQNVFVSTDAQGKRKETCCPRCGLHYALNHGGRALRATDFSTGKPIRAEDAIYLEGSDLMQCCSAVGFRSSEGVYNDIQYDRCMPSLLAFSKVEEAETVRRQHGGQIITFEEAKDSVARQLSGT